MKYKIEKTIKVLQNATNTMIDDVFIYNTKKINLNHFDNIFKIKMAMGNIDNFKIYRDLEGILYSDLEKNNLKKNIDSLKNKINDLKKNKVVENDFIYETIESIKDDIDADWLNDNCTILNGYTYFRIKDNIYLNIDDLFQANERGDNYYINDLDFVVYVDGEFKDNSDYEYEVDHYGDLCDRDDLVWIEQEGEYYQIDDCHCCDDCGEYFINGHIDDDNTICNTCYDNNFYATCYFCGTIAQEDEYSIDEDGDAVCSNCRENGHGNFRSECEDDRVYSYSYKPTPTFYGEGEYHLGLELEFSSVDDIESICDTVEEHSEIYMKEDSSVALELVTHPCTYDHFVASGILDTIASLNEYGNAYTKNGIAGIHIHISRSAFFCDEHFSNFYDLINNNEEFSKIVAQRNETTYQKYAPTEVPKCKDITINYGEHGRYSAINIQNTHTIEVRIFNSNLIKDRILKNLQYIEALIKYSKSYSDLDGFKEFIRTSNYKELNDFLVSRDAI